MCCGVWPVADWTGERADKGASTGAGGGRCVRAQRKKSLPTGRGRVGMEGERKAGAGGALGRLASAGAGAVAAGPALQVTTECTWYVLCYSCTGQGCAACSGAEAVRLVSIFISAMQDLRQEPPGSFQLLAAGPGALILRQLATPDPWLHFSRSARLEAGLSIIEQLAPPANRPMTPASAIAGKNKTTFHVINHDTLR